jgi:tetratricopeptide (TPR) repeat protein
VRLAVTEGVVEVRRTDAVEGEGGELRRIRAGESWSALLPRHPQLPPAESPAAVEADVDAELEASEPAQAKSERRDGAQRAASEVWKQASVARRAGRMQEAAQAYSTLIARHPEDARAGLAAFELGRIRMDALGDPGGAIDALERSLAAGSSASFHEDALARIVIAHDALGRTAACQRARERYLASYPSGVHAHALLARCR